MLLLFCTHSVLFYVGLMNYNDFAKSLQADNCQDLHRVVCVAQCLEKSSIQKTALILNGSDFDKNEVSTFVIILIFKFKKYIKTIILRCI